MAPVKLTDKDIDYLVRLVATEADHKLVWSHPEEYSAQVHGIVDTVLNRVASGKWGSTVESVANANRQFSKIAGPKSNDPYGSVDKVPDSDIPAFLPNIVTSWVTTRAKGTPSSVGGNLHYANPTFSDASNMGWINALDGPKLGYGDSTHWHGTTSGYSPVEAQVEYGPKTSTDILQSLHDRVAATRGFGEIAPVPAIRSDVLTELRNRAQGVAGVSVTPRLLSEGGEVTGMEDPRPELAWDQFREGVDVGGMGSLVDGRISPTMPNPQRQLLAVQLGVRPLDAPPIPGRAPTMEQLAAIRDVSRVAPVPAPSGIDARPQDLSLRAAPSPASGPAAGRPGGATEVPGFGGGKVDNSRPSSPTVAPMVRQPQMGVWNGKPVEIGRSYIAGDRLMIAGIGPDGETTLRDVEDISNEALSTIHPMAPMLFDDSPAGLAVRMIAAPMVKQQIAGAGNALKDAAGGILGDVSRLVGSIASQAKDTIGSMFEPKTLAATPTRDPVGGGATFDQVQRMSRTSAPLAAPGQGLTQAQRAAMAAYTPQAKPTVVAPVAAPTTKTVANPAYAEWERKYGDGSQIQTAPTGGMITKNQLAAIQAVPDNSVQPMVPKPLPRPPAPPKTIKVTVTPPKTAPVPLQRPVVTAPTVYESGGYLYEPNPGGGYTKVGKAGSKTTAPVVAPKNSSSSTTSSGQAKTASDGTSWAANW